MEMSDQTLAEFAVLAVTGIVMSAVAAIMVSDHGDGLPGLADTLRAQLLACLSAPVVSEAVLVDRFVSRSLRR
jgi:hypothetical protein